MSLQVARANGGFLPTDLSVSHSVLKSLKGLDDQGGVKCAAAHLVAPIATLAAQVLDVVYHAASAVTKTAFILPRGVVYGLTFGKFDPLSFASPSDALEHTKRAIVGVPLAPVASAVSLFSIGGAVSVINSVGAGQSEAVKGWVEKFKAADWKEKFKLVLWETPKESAVKAWEVVKEGFNSAKDNGWLKKGIIGAGVVGGIVGSDYAQAWFREAESTLLRQGFGWTSEQANAGVCFARSYTPWACGVEGGAGGEGGDG